MTSAKRSWQSLHVIAALWIAVLLAACFDLQRQGQWRLDFIAAENSIGFHAPQEAARVLGEAADLARQGQIAAMKAGGGTAKPSND